MPGDRGESTGKRLRKIYQLIKDLNKKWTPKLRTIKDKHGKTLQTSGEITKEWAECCQELFKKTDTNVNAELTSLRETSLYNLDIFHNLF